ncbi:MAG: response regulator transcription factor [Bacteroidales bacterium]
MIEDDESFGSVLKSYLELNGFKVVWQTAGRTVEKTILQVQPDICILDVMLPEVDGFTLAARIRNLKPSLPFLFLTARSQINDIRKGFGTGAEDYLTKPFDSEVLVLKVRAILSRTSTFKDAEPRETVIGKFLFDYEGRKLISEHQVRHLTPREADLLKMLYDHRNSVLKRETVLNALWGDTSWFNNRNLDVYISRLRKYLSDDRGIEIITLHGKGYRMVIQE